MMVSAIGYGGMSTAAVWQRYQYWNAAVRGTAAVAPVSGREGGAPIAAVTPVSGQEKSVPAAASGRGAAAAAGAANTALAPSEMPYIPEGYGPEELATRTRIQFPGLGFSPEEQAEFRLPWETEDDGEDVPGVEGVEDTESAAETAEDAKCETCEKRKYQDGSDDPGVSFKTATRVAPEAAQAAVRGHEMEHVVREQAKARQEGRKVVSQSVTYHTGICPECGKIYIAGGTTRTVTAAGNTADNNAADDMKERLRKRFSGTAIGTGLDATA